mmetsp:Transcript_27219/g.78296  ORF Transcript_27219/g.78296 Transcript_27219/m.78296 type:complete len:264 (-) Transcript_27219:729-1520(-)
MALWSGAILVCVGGGQTSVAARMASRSWSAPPVGITPLDTSEATNTYQWCRCSILRPLPEISIHSGDVDGPDGGLCSTISATSVGSCGQWRACSSSMQLAISQRASDNGSWWKCGSVACRAVLARAKSLWGARAPHWCSDCTISRRSEGDRPPSSRATIPFESTSLWSTRRLSALPAHVCSAARSASPPPTTPLMDSSTRSTPRRKRSTSVSGTPGSSMALVPSSVRLVLAASMSMCVAVESMAAADSRARVRRAVGGSALAA